MDARPKTRQVNRERKTPPPQAPRGAKQIVIPMIRQQYDGIWQDAERLRAFVDEWAQFADYRGGVTCLARTQFFRRTGRFSMAFSGLRHLWRESP